MKDYLSVIRSSQLFSGVSEEEVIAMLSCLKAERKDFPKDAFLLRAGDTAESIGLVLSGSVLVIQEDIWGNRNILSKAGPGQTFAAAFACAPGSRLGTTLANFNESLLPLLDGLHFHTLCEQNSDDLETTARAFEEKFGKYLHGLKWVNFGGGHHITRPDYDIERLVRTIEHFRDTYGVQVYLEPGEAVVYHAGFLVASGARASHSSTAISTRFN